LKIAFTIPISNPNIKCLSIQMDPITLLEHKAKIINKQTRCVIYGYLHLFSLSVYMVEKPQNKSNNWYWNRLPIIVHITTSQPHYFIEWESSKVSAIFISVIFFGWETVNRTFILRKFSIFDYGEIIFQLNPHFKSSIQNNIFMNITIFGLCHFLVIDVNAFKKIWITLWLK